MTANPTETTPTPASVDDFLAQIDDVLADNGLPGPAPAAPVVPAPAAPIDTLAPAPVLPAPDVDVEHAPAPEPVPLHARPREVAWWEGVYDDQRADLDTFTGSTPEERAAALTIRAAQPPPPLPVAPPVALPVAPVAQPADDDQDDVDDDDQDDAVEADEEEDAAAGRKRWPWSKAEPAVPEAVAVAPAVVVPAGAQPPAATKKKEKGGPFLTPIGRVIVYLGSAALVGKGLGLFDALSHAAQVAPDFVAPVCGVALSAGLGAIWLRVPHFGAIFVGSLGVVAAAALVDPGWSLVIAAPALLWIADTAYVRWLHKGGAPHPIWRYVTWASRIPFGTSLAVLLWHGTH